MTPLILVHMVKFVFCRIETLLEKEKKCFILVFSPCPTMFFQKASSLGLLKYRIVLQTVKLQSVGFYSLTENVCWIT